jgi:hypothetical protein
MRRGVLRPAQIHLPTRCGEPAHIRRSLDGKLVVSMIGRMIGMRVVLSYFNFRRFVAYLEPITFLLLSTF